MAGDVEVLHLEDFLRLSKAAKRIDVDLRKALHKGLQDAGKPLLPDVKASFIARLPRGGGLGQFMARKRLRVKVATGADPGISIVAGKTQPRLDLGVIGHPLFGRRGPRGALILQRVPAGSFSDPLVAGLPRVRPVMEQVVVDVGEQLVRAVDAGGGSASR